jgi:hypothetical protein
VPPSLPDTGSDAPLGREKQREGRIAGENKWWRRGRLLRRRRTWVAPESEINLLEKVTERLEGLVSLGGVT